MKHFSFQLDPRTKIFLMVIVSVSLLVGESAQGNRLYKILFTIIPITLLIFEKHLKGALIFTFLYIAISLSGYLFKYISETSLLGVSISLMMGLIAGMGPCMIMGYYMISSTKVSEFICAMEKIHISNNFIIPFAVMFRFFPTIKEEYLSIRDAMRMRGIQFNRNILSMLEYRLVPLMISMVKIGDELSAAAMTRGLGNDTKRTHVCTIGFHLADAIYVSISILLCFLYLIN